MQNTCEKEDREALDYAMGVLRLLTTSRRAARNLLGDDATAADLTRCVQRICQARAIDENEIWPSPEEVIGGWHADSGSTPSIH